MQVRGFQRLVMEKNIFSKYVLRNAQKPRFVREHDTSGLISKLGIKDPWNKIPLLSDILFQERFKTCPFFSINLCENLGL